MDTRLTQAQPYTLGLFRIVIGTLFTCHGVASLFGLLGGHSLPAGSWPGWYAAVIQLGAGGLVLLGLGTRTAALLGSGSMAFAYFDIHQRRGLLPIENGGEAAVFFCWTLLLIAVSGPGAVALDRLINGRRAARAAHVADVDDAAGRAGGEQPRQPAASGPDQVVVARTAS
ncbi:DoxX family protein [Streptomyces sp. SID10853]|uniref:DoxX family protein n=1 Tax=Streptomyces sp. SID10853 TaxID=2706028 RepID=UPI0013BED12A|nr:DoxX family protein [Streptomyces sp. SID10853]NDZ79110.1 DoxX family protein [Streptomyces sp. SID10853]